MSAAGPDDRASHNTVDSFPTDPRRAREQVERYTRELGNTKTYLAALNMQVSTRHWEAIRQPMLCAIDGEAIHDAFVRP